MYGVNHGVKMGLANEMERGNTTEQAVNIGIKEIGRGVNNEQCTTEENFTKRLPALQSKGESLVTMFDAPAQCGTRLTVFTNIPPM